MRTAVMTSLSSQNLELTARTRLRNAAIECFAIDGFDVSVRTIASQAAVSAGLIRHHFGSKDLLREECDAAVLTTLRELKSAAVEMPSGQLMELLAQADEYGGLLLYILRSVRDGGSGGRAFLEHMIADAQEYTRKAIDTGLLKPSHDPEARVRYLVMQGVGGMIVALSRYPNITMDNFSAIMSEIMADMTLPQLELYSQGLFADSSVFDEYLRATGRTDRPASTQS
ncbi:AcrR family transcriptional regulator [Arthrobacter pascens]|uniref:TetR/AcrR family transcriptional regulator n=1 Tax=Arthrobacter pascens TaxID=1677 RepID=UPI00277DE243|nr:TetR family transcriptional regulator [Arthrobacter pascens]MDQ0635174.1 AcrR family transcriptional regulator [Arthrobacter pascens]